MFPGLSEATWENTQGDSNSIHLLKTKVLSEIESSTITKQSTIDCPLAAVYRDVEP